MKISQIVLIFITTILAVVVLLGGIWFANINKDVKSCESFWKEKCVLEPVPSSIHSSFSNEYYESYKAQQKELEQELSIKESK